MHLFFFDLKGVNFLFNSQPCFLRSSQQEETSPSQDVQANSSAEKNRGWDSSAHRQLSKCSAAQMRWAASCAAKNFKSQHISTAAKRLFGQSFEFNGFGLFVDGNRSWSINVVFTRLNPLFPWAKSSLPLQWPFEHPRPNLMILVLLCFNGIQRLQQEQNRRKKGVYSWTRNSLMSRASFHLCHPCMWGCVLNEFWLIGGCSECAQAWETCHLKQQSNCCRYFKTQGTFPCGIYKPSKTRGNSTTYTWQQPISP